MLPIRLFTHLIGTKHVREKQSGKVHGLLTTVMDTSPLWNEGNGHIGGDGSFSPPPDWKTDNFGKKKTSFRNERRGLEVGIRTVYKRSRAQRHGRNPTHYVVQLHQDWFAKGTLGKRDMAAKATTWDEALTVARDFMEEFSRELKEKPSEEIQATHGTVGDHETADDMITAEVAAEALADAAGYSDELLLSVLDAETDRQYQLVVHRNGDTLTTVSGDESDVAEDNILQMVHAVFPIDRTGIKHVLDEQTPISVVTHLSGHTVYRFIFDDARETDIVLPRGTQVLSPVFETSIANVLEEKW